MNRADSRTADGEQGVALILVITVMLVLALVSTGLFTLITSSVSSRGTLDATRNREYAADAAVETAIARVRALGNPGPGFIACGGPDTVTLNNVSIQVACANAPTLTIGLYTPRNVIFTATCISDGTACPDGTVVTRAQVNYASPDSPSSYQTGDITRTYVQSWSVNR